MTLSLFFGPLELQVLETLWRLRREASVRDLSCHFPGVAYTTLMTTLDRLYKKGVLARRKSGRAFHYSPMSSRKELEGILAAEAIDSLLGPLASRHRIRPLLTSFVEAVSRRDEVLLADLEEIVRARRRDASHKGDET